MSSCMYLANGELICKGTQQLESFYQESPEYLQEDFALKKGAAGSVKYGGTRRPESFYQGVF